KDYDVKIGDRIAQLILIPVAYAGIVKVESLDDTDRSAGGFGSTGR
ncbi:MAG: deoxyuridine 5 -triphosphate nucleotidohydrolase, partial [Solumvirus sp.]